MRLARSSGVFWMLVCLLCVTPGLASAQTTRFVYDEGDLHDALSVAASGDTIRFGANVILTSDLPSVERSLTIDGNGFTLSGANQYRGLAILAPAWPYPTVRIQDLTIANTVVTGGAGESGSSGGGGGGGGLGGAIFVGRNASLTLARVSITGSTAVGGAGGDAAAGGGTGGTSSTPSAWDPSFGAGGDGGPVPWHGGFGAGGGGTLVGFTGEGSDFAGGQGGSSATGGGGGGGAGLGGAIFLEELSSLTIEDGVSIAGNSVQGGAGAAGGTNGAAYGSGFFLHGSETLQFNPGAGTTTIVNDAIVDTVGVTNDPAFATSRWELWKVGDGTVVLGGNNRYSGGTTVDAGTLRVSSNASLGNWDPSLSGTELFLRSTGTLEITGSNEFNRELRLSGSPTIRVGGGVAATWSGEIWGAGGLHVTGGGSLTLSRTVPNLINSYSGGTLVTGGSTLIVTPEAGVDSALGTGGLTLGNAVSSGTLGLAAGLSLFTTRTIQLEAGGGRFDAGAGSVLELGNVVSGTGSLTKIGAGTLLLSTVASHTGGTNINAGTLRAGLTDVFPTTSLSIADGATFDLNSFNQTIGSLSGAGQVALGSAALTTGGNGANTTFGGVISGTGALVKTGAGSFTLTGANTYSGGTTVSDGTLIGTTTSLRGDILNAAAVTFDQAAAGTYAGVMSGAGRLTKAGIGSLTLTGANTYSGGTTVSGGMLIGTTTSLQGNILNNAGVTFDQAFNGTYGGVLSGSGTLTKAGAGTMLLASATSHTGGTTIDAGTLQAGVANVFAPASALRIAGGALFDLNGFNQTIGSLAGTSDLALGSATLTTGGNDANTTFSGVVSGAGSLVKIGTGALTLTGGNTYSGGTTVSGGALIGTAASLQGSILNNAAVTFDQALDGTYGGVMSGTGTLTKSGAGSLTLTGTNTYSGGTTISGGLLTGNASSLQGDILNNAAIQFDQAGIGTYGGVISGTGTFSKTGAGTLTLERRNTFTGAAAIDAGTLRAGTANVFSPATAVSVASGATFDLDGFNQSIGTLSGGGNFALGSATLTTGGDNSSATLAGVISGPGSIVKSGSGTLTLTGANTYSGGTTVSGGILLGTTTSLQGNILNDARVTFDQGFNGTYAGAMSGTGSLTKSGAGTLTLTGVNTYIGGTTVAGGTLIGNARSLQGSISTNGLLVFDQAVAGTFDGSLAGSGSLQKLGAGALTLRGTNTLTGSTLLSEGVLRAGAANVFSSSGAIALGAGTTLDLNGFSHTLNNLSGPGSITLGGAQLTTGTDGGSATLAGVISGPGSIVKSGSGTLTLTGANTYSGGTTVSGGILLGTTTSLQGNILNDARVVFDQGFDGTYAGGMSGTGILEKAGTGTLTLTGRNTYSGGTLISGGSIVATPASLAGPVVDHGSLTFSGSSDGPFGGTLGGTGSLKKTGTCTLTLNGAHPFSGLTTVSQGRLALNGTLGGSIVVEPGASFAGAGGLLGSLTLNGGTLTIPAREGAQSMMLAASTGDRLETAPLLTVGGNLIAGSDSVLSIPVGPGPIPSLYVGGVAALNGATIDARPITLGAQRNLSYLALGAGTSLTVANTTVETANPLLLSSLRKNGNTLAVNIVNLGVPLETAVSPRFSLLGGAIDRLKADTSGDRFFVIRELLSLDDDELDDAMKQIAGEAHASNRHVEIRSSETFTDLIRSELTDRDHEAEGGQAGWGGPRVRWFGQMSREHVSFGPQDGAAGGGADITDGAGGFEVRVSDRWIVGGGGGLGFGSMSLDGLSAGSDFSAPRAFGVVGFKPKGFGIRGGGSLSRSKAKNTRRIVIVATLPEELGGGPLSGGIDREAKSEEVTVQSDQWTEYADHWDFGTYRIDYMFGVRRARFARDSFVETGAGSLSLEYDGGTLNLTDTDVKVHWWRRKGGIRPYVETFFRRSSGFDYALPVEFADEEDSDFETAGLPMGVNAFAARVGVTFVRRIGALTFEYRIRKASGQTSQTADLRFRF